MARGYEGLPRDLQIQERRPRTRAPTDLLYAECQGRACLRPVPSNAKKKIADEHQVTKNCRDPQLSLLRLTRLLKRDRAQDYTSGYLWRTEAHKQQ